MNPTAEPPATNSELSKITKYHKKDAYKQDFIVLLQRIAIKYKKCGICATFLLIIWTKPRVTYHYAIGFQTLSPAKPKKNYRMNVDQYLPKFVAPNKISYPYKLFMKHDYLIILNINPIGVFAKILDELILNFCDHSMRFIDLFQK